MHTPTAILLLTLGFAQFTSSASGENVRFASFNVSHHRRTSGKLAQDLADGKNRKSQKIAEIIQTVRPDVILLNEFDYDESGEAAQLFQKRYLEVGQNGKEPLRYEYSFLGPVNTGIDSGFDLNNDGKTGGAADCFGYGVHPGQYGMLLLSKFPIEKQGVRTFQKFLWKDMPNALRPTDGEGNSYYATDAWNSFRLSSKSHWDIPLKIGKVTIHFLAAHPTPPVFDGPEDRNGKRNHDEIRLLADYIDPHRGGYIYDDRSKRGGLVEHARFVIAGDLNADPHDGDSANSAIRQLLDHRLVNTSVTPNSEGGAEQAKLQGGVNRHHKGDASHDTADFGDRGRGSGNLRIDYVLPSRNLEHAASGVFWPKSSSQDYSLLNATDHRLVWVDLSIN